MQQQIQGNHPTNQPNKGSSLCHQLGELRVVNLPILVGISLANNVLDFIMGKPVGEASQRCDDGLQLLGCHVAIVVKIKDLEGLSDLVGSHRVGVLPDHPQERGKVQQGVAVRVKLLDDVVELSLVRTPTKGAENRANLFASDLPVVVTVEEGKGLLKLRQLLFGEVRLKKEKER